MLGTIGATVSAAKTVVLVALPAKAPDAGGFYKWLTGNPVRIVLAIVAITVIIGANRGKVTKAVTTALIVVVGLFIMTSKTAMEGITAWLGSYFS